MSAANPKFLFSLAPGPLPRGGARAGAAFSDDGNDGSRHFGGGCLRLVGDEPAQERNEQNERDADHEAASAERAGYSTRLQENSRRPQPDEMRSIFAGLGLGGDFWDPQSDTFG